MGYRLEDIAGVYKLDEAKRLLSSADRKELIHFVTSELISHPKSYRVVCSAKDHDNFVFSNTPVWNWSLFDYWIVDCKDTVLIDTLTKLDRLQPLELFSVWPDPMTIKGELIRLSRTGEVYRLVDYWIVDCGCGWRYDDPKNNYPRVAQLPELNRYERHMLWRFGTMSGICGGGMSGLSVSKTNGAICLAANGAPITANCTAVFAESDLVHLSQDTVDWLLKEYGLSGRLIVEGEEE